MLVAVVRTFARSDSRGRTLATEILRESKGTHMLSPAVIHDGIKFVIWTIQPQDTFQDELSLGQFHGWYGYEELGSNITTRLQLARLIDALLESARRDPQSRRNRDPAVAFHPCQFVVERHLNFLLYLQALLCPS